MTTPTSNCSGQITPMKEAIDSRCIVKFVPHTDWKGEYGFDWYRTEDIENTYGHFISLDSINQLYEEYYPNIVGKYAPNDPDKDINVIEITNKGFPYLTQIENEYTPIIPIVDLDDDSCHPYYCTPYISLFYKSMNSTKFYLPDFMKKDKNHILDWLTTEAKVDLLISAKGIKKIEFKLDDNVSNDCISVVDKKGEPAIISPVADGNSTKEIIIKLNYDFYGAYQPIKAYAIHQDNSETLAGQINVVKCIPKQVNVCLVNVKCICPGSGTKINGLSKTQIEQQKKMLRRYLSQAHLVPNFVEKDLDEEKKQVNLADFWENGNVFTFKMFEKPRFANDYAYPPPRQDEINAWKAYPKFVTKRLEGAFNRAYPAFSNYIKIFFLGMEGYDYDYNWDWFDFRPKDKFRETKTNFRLYGGFAGDVFPSSACVVCKNATTACHELLHCLGLYHSFSNNSKHTFQKYQTSNIMDYPNPDYQVENPEGQNISLWRWQWEKIRSTVNFRC